MINTFKKWARKPKEFLFPFCLACLLAKINEVNGGILIISLLYYYAPFGGPILRNQQQHAFCQMTFCSNSTQHNGLGALYIGTTFFPRSK